MKKRTCNGCKALYFLGCNKIKCDLGYPIDEEEIKPLVECPKPKTNMQLINSDIYKVRSG